MELSTELSLKIVILRWSVTWLLVMSPSPAEGFSAQLGSAHDLDKFIRGCFCGQKWILKNIKNALKETAQRPRKRQL